MTNIINSSLSLDQVGKKAWTSSTLLIPKHLLDYFTQRVAFFAGRRHYLRYLIVTYGRYLEQFGMLPYTSKWKKQYQDQNLDLQICNFKPEPHFWEELRHIGLAYGLGMCKLFVVMLELEQKRWIEAGSPERFIEQPPQNNKITNKKMNSIQVVTKSPKFNLETLGLNQKCTILYRNINFSELKLDRIGFIRQL